MERAVRKERSRCQDKVGAPTIAARVIVKARSFVDFFAGPYGAGGVAGGVAERPGRLDFQHRKRPCRSRKRLAAAKSSQSPFVL
jgi:hypothetical protein